MITCTRRLEFDYGHRVFKHESKCAHLHGHRGVIEITALAELDSLGRVIDFSVLKKLIGGWIDTHWDHNMILFIEDTQAINAVKMISDNKDPFLLKTNPTAENMADYLLKVVCPEVLKGTEVKVISVRFHETPNGMAEAKYA